MEANLLQGEMEETFVGLGKLLEIRLDISVADLDSRGSRLFKKTMGSM
jgi:hypothetical protein